MLVQMNQQQDVIINLMSTLGPSLTVTDEKYLHKLRLNEKTLQINTSYNLNNEDQIAFGDVIVSFLIDEDIRLTPMRLQTRNKLTNRSPPSSGTVIPASPDDDSSTDVEDLDQSCSGKYDKSIDQNSRPLPHIFKLLLEDTGLDPEPDVIFKKSEKIEADEDIHEVLTQRMVLPIPIVKDESVFEAETQDLISIPDISIKDDSQMYDDTAESQSLLPSLASIENNEDQNESQLNIYNVQTQPDLAYQNPSSPIADISSKKFLKKLKKFSKELNIYEMPTQTDNVLNGMCQPNSMSSPSHNRSRIPLTPINNPVYEALTQIPREFQPNHYSCKQEIINDLIENSPDKKIAETVFATSSNNVNKTVGKVSPAPTSSSVSVLLNLSKSDDIPNGENYYDTTQDVLADLQSVKIPEDSVRRPADRTLMPCKNLLTDEAFRNPDEESDDSGSPMLCTSLTSLDSQEIGLLVPPSPAPQLSDRDPDVSAEENSEPLVFRRCPPVKKRKSANPPFLPPSRVSKRRRRSPARFGDSIMGDFDSQVCLSDDNRKKTHNPVVIVEPIIKVTKRSAPRKTIKDPSNSMQKSKKPTESNKLSEKSCKAVSASVVSSAAGGRLYNVECDETTESEKQDSDSLGRTRRSTAEPITRVMLSGFTDERMANIVTNIGGQVVTSNAQVLVTNDVRKTFKLLLACAEGIPIVPPKWLTKSKQVKRFVDPSGFVLKDISRLMGIESLIGKRFPSGRSSILSNHLIFITPSIKPSPQEMNLLVEAFEGTTVLIKNGGAKEFSNINDKKCLMISCEQDKHLWQDAPCSVFTVDLIIELALSHSLHYTNILKC